MRFFRKRGVFYAHIYIYIILLGVSTGCNPTKNNILAPNKRLYNQLPKQAELYPDYRQGWLDGCQTGMSTGFANDYYKMFYKFTKDRDRVKRGVKPYLRAWSSAMIYCRHFVVGTLGESKMNPRLPGQGFPLSLGGDKAPDGMAMPGHGIIDIWQPYRHGAQGLDLW